LSSDELFPEVSKPQFGWDALEKRINRLLESVVQLRNSNGQLMKENMALRNQLRDKSLGASPSTPTGTSPTASPETEKLRKNYEQALEDLKQLQKNLLHMEKLTAELRNGKKHSDSEML
jgi:regulator of replication initiation timing